MMPLRLDACTGGHVTGYHYSDPRNGGSGLWYAVYSRAPACHGGNGPHTHGDTDADPGEPTRADCAARYPMGSR
jgi:hypothetical protein